jgi:hypothetical protein
VDRENLEHVIAAAAEVSGEREFVVVGSQAILGSHPDAPKSMLRSMEADIYPRNSPEKTIEIDGSLGDGSYFQLAYGYYAHGVGPETAKPPAGWEGRLVAVEIAPRVASNRSAIAYFLEAHDLVLSKCAAGRDRDWEFAHEALSAGLVSAEMLLSRASDLPVSEARRKQVRARLRTIAAGL